MFLLSIRVNLYRKLPGLAEAKEAFEPWVMLGSLPLLYPLPISLVPYWCHRWQIFTPILRQKDVSEAVFISTELIYNLCCFLSLSLLLFKPSCHLLGGDLPKSTLPHLFQALSLQPLS